MCTSWTLDALAKELGALLVGDTITPIVGVADLKEAQAGEVSFAGNPKYYAAAAASNASAVIVPMDYSVEAVPALLKVADVEKAFAKACELFAPVPVALPPGIHPSAVVSPSASIGAHVSIGALAVVEDGAVIGDNTILYPQTYVGHQVVIGADCIVYPFASIRERCSIGNRVILHNGVVIGSDGFGYTVDAAGVRTKIPQTGIVEIEDDVEIGANTTIDRARFGRTVIGKGTKVDNLVQIAHNCRIGEHSVLCAQVGMAGTCTLGKHVICAGQVGLAGHLTIGDGAVVGAQSGVPSSLPGGQMYLGSPAVPRIDFGRNVANVTHIPKLKKQIKELQDRLNELEQRVTDA